MENKNYIKNILNHFKLKGDVLDIVPINSGHIHDTYRIINTDSRHPDYLLQKMNHQVFKNIPGLMNNIQLVTDHIRKKLTVDNNTEFDNQVLTLVYTLLNTNFYVEENDQYWRVYHFLKNTRSYDIVKTQNQAFEGGKAFGGFVAMLSDLDPKSLCDTIPHFHDVEDRFLNLIKAISDNPKNRVKEVKSEIDFVSSRIEKMTWVIRSGREGLIPKRVVHNDTKFNNVLLDEHDRAQCVVDLDTVMPGFVAYDFGDATRTIVNTCQEDGNIDSIDVDLDLFKGFAEGFLSKTASFLHEKEIESLSHGVLLLPYIMGLRFLTDYINGDQYYKINYPEHNLQRARAQFKLVSRLEENFSGICKIIEDSAEIYRSLTVKS